LTIKASYHKFKCSAFSSQLSAKQGLIVIAKSFFRSLISTNPLPCLGGAKARGCRWLWGSKLSIKDNSSPSFSGLPSILSRRRQGLKALTRPTVPATKVRAQVAAACLALYIFLAFVKKHELLYHSFQQGIVQDFNLLPIKAN